MVQRFRIPGRTALPATAGVIEMGPADGPGRGAIAVVGRPLGGDLEGGVDGVREQ